MCALVSLAATSDWFTGSPSTTGVHKGVPTRFSHRVFPEDVPGGCSRRVFPQGVPTGSSHRVFPQDSCGKARRASAHEGHKSRPASICWSGRGPFRIATSNISRKRQVLSLHHFDRFLAPQTILCSFCSLVLAFAARSAARSRRGERGEPLLLPCVTTLHISTAVHKGLFEYRRGHGFWNSVFELGSSGKI